MSRALQPYASFPIENNGDNFLSNKFSSINWMLTGDGQESAMFSKM